MNSLVVIHLRKGQYVGPRPHGLAAAFHLDTCQRWIWVTTDAAHAAFEGAEVFRNQAAYLFLLEVATGLQSELRGETDIFGQLKEAWKNFAAERTSEAAALAPWIQRLFEDTKDIRARFLQNIGGASYGSLVRKLLPENEGPVLLVGAGAVAKAIGPWLADRELWLLNRTTERAEALASDLIAKGAKEIRIVAPERASVAWRECRHAVVCVPEDAQLDAERVATWNSREESDRLLVHLSVYSHLAGAWAEARGFVGIDRLFALKSNQESERSVIFNRAIKACHERAQLRFLAGSDGKASLAHGWEDLLVFA